MIRHDLPCQKAFCRIELGGRGGRKIAQFMLIGLLLQAGLAMGMSGADSAFLAHAGADKLPRIYLLVPVIMLVYVPACSALMSRWGCLDRVFAATLGPPGCRRRGPVAGPEPSRRRAGPAALLRRQALRRHLVRGRLHPVLEFHRRLLRPFRRQAALRAAVGGLGARGHPRRQPARRAGLAGISASRRSSSAGRSLFAAAAWPVAARTRRRHG